MVGCVPVSNSLCKKRGIRGGKPGIIAKGKRVRKCGKKEKNRPPRKKHNRGSNPRPRAERSGAIAFSLQATFTTTAFGEFYKHRRRLNFWDFCGLAHFAASKYGRAIFWQFWREGPSAHEFWT